MKITMNMDEINVLARTIYGEARGEYARRDGGRRLLRWAMS